MENTSENGFQPYRFTPEDFGVISDIVYREAGICLSDVKSALVYSRLVKRVRSLGLPSFRDYCAVVRRPESDAERQKMISALTTNVTRFHREEHHYRHFGEQVLPALLKRAASGGRIRLWSAACATGEEAYGLAFRILEKAPNAPDMDIRILATDIDPPALAIAEAGKYSVEALAPLGKEMIQSFFDPVDDAASQMKVGASPRRLITFRRLNLIRAWPVRGPFDVVFCRNVAIYFDSDTQAGLWQGFADVMAPNGALYIGHSERITGPAAACFRLEGTTTYRMRGENTGNDHATKEIGKE
ncbi:MAG: protein-glutamate O-methyltransferase [Paracoccaceae bacterium]